MHFDLTSQSGGAAGDGGAGALAGRPAPRFGQPPEEKHVVLADPEGNEFCVIEPGNGFLAECGFIGALTSEGTQEVGYYWSRALGWPLVWDQDQETAIRAPYGGPKIAWGGPPVGQKTEKNRLHFDLAPTSAVTRASRSVARLSRGHPHRRRPGRGRWVAMADPDGNEFCLLTPR